MVYTIETQIHILCFSERKIFHFKCSQWGYYLGVRVKDPWLTNSTLYVIPTNTLCIVPNSGFMYSKLLNQMWAYYSVFRLHECSTCSTKSRLSFCLHKLKNLTCWPNRPIMLIWIASSYVPLAWHCLFTQWWVWFVNEKAKETNLKDKKGDLRIVLHSCVW